MKIISKYHDYYDNVRAYGTDNSVMYIRKKQMFNKGSQEYKLAYKILKLDELFHVRLYSDFISNYWIISFCGKIFPIIEYYFGSFKQICHTLETAHKVIKKYSVVFVRSFIMLQTFYLSVNRYPERYSFF